MFLSAFNERMYDFDDMVEKQGRDIGVDEVFNLLQEMKQELNNIQGSLNLYKNTIPKENQGVNPSNLQSESIRNNRIRITESQSQMIIKEAINGDLFF